MSSDIPLPATGHLVPSSLEFPVVGIGASAGGVPALRRFFERMPPDSGMAFVVILHLSSQHASHLPSVLQGVTQMEVVQVQEPCTIEANRVYLIPPGKQLAMDDHQLHVSDPDRPRVHPVTVDLFFRALALVHRERAIGIVLSGTGSDGAGGIAHLKEHGGVTLAQAPEDAEFDGMPRAAIASEAIDWVLPVDAMPGKLLEIWRNLPAIELPRPPEGTSPVSAPLAPDATKEAEDALRDSYSSKALPIGNFALKPAGLRDPVPERRRIGYAELHQRLAEQYAPPTLLVDADARIVHLSEKAGRFLQHAGGEPTPHLLTLVRPELRLELRTALFQAMQSGRSVEARRVKIGDDDGERSRHVNMIVRPVAEPTTGAKFALVLFDEVEDTRSPHAQGADGSARDPLVAHLEAELRRTQEQLQETIEQYEASNEELLTVNHELKARIDETGKINDDLQNLIASTDIATVFIDRGMAIKRYTPRATEIFSIVPSDIGRSLLDIRHRLDYEQLGEDAAEAFQSLRRVEREVRSSDGRCYLARLLPYRTTEDRIAGAVLSFVDITGSQRVQSEREAQLAQDTARLAEVQAASDLKDEFLAILSHELKNPLNLIQMNAELLTRLPAARGVPAVVSAAETIRKTVHSQAQIIDDLLDLSRLNTGKLALHPEAVALGATVRRIVEAMAEDAARKELAVQVEAPPDEILVHADPVRVEQIVWNLLSNAFKFTPRGGRIEVRLAAAQGMGCLEVQDSGKGIDPAFLPRVFDMFQQAEGRSTRREGGLGIGLALVRHLTELQGGQVEARSAGAGQGATFVVRLPLLRRDSSSGGGDGSAALEGRFEGLRVLVVQDDAAAAQALCQLLELEGIAITRAADVPHALELCEQADLDAILSDLAMPGMDGIALVTALRRMPRHAATRVVAMTGFDRPVDVRRATEAGFDALLGKPLTLERLLQTFDELGLPQRTPGG